MRVLSYMHCSAIGCDSGGTNVLFCCCHCCWFLFVVTPRFLPDKAIDLVDEAAAKLKMEITSKPEALDEIDRKVLQLEMERLSLQKVGRSCNSLSCWSYIMV